MSVTIKLNYLRHSPRKLRAVTRLFGGKSLVQALNETAVMPQHSAVYLHKALLMAQNSAKQKEFDTDKMVIKAIMATDGPKIKRMRPTARGRASKYIKHVAHLSVTLEMAPEKVEKVRASKSKKKVTPEKEKSN